MLSLPGIETLERQHHALMGLQSFQNSVVKQVGGTVLDLLLRHAAREQRPHTSRRKRHPALLGDLFRELRGVRRLGADHDNKAAG